MPKIFWTIARKKRLLKYADALTVEKLSKKFRQTPEEIERMLQLLYPAKVPKVRVYYQYINNKRMKITVYSSRTAYGAAIRQLIGNDIGIDLSS